jgi:hypothetical protein
MSELVADLFAEDRAHEALLSAFLQRLAREEQRQVLIQVRSARGGHGRALDEFELYQRAMAAQNRLPRMLVVCIDGNCTPANRAHREINERIHDAYRDRAVIACPDPHIERWYLADPISFEQVVGSTVSPGRRKCERGRYKEILVKAIRKADHPLVLGGVEFAAELVEQMDLYRAGKRESSLARFVRDARRAFRTS